MKEALDFKMDFVKLYHIVRFPKRMSAMNNCIKKTEEHLDVKTIFIHSLEEKTKVKNFISHNFNIEIASILRLIIDDLFSNIEINNIDGSFIISQNRPLLKISFSVLEKKCYMLEIDDYVSKLNKELRWIERFLAWCC